MSIKCMTAVWQSAQVNSTQLLVLLCLADFADEENTCYPSQETIAQKCRMSTRNVRDIVSKLESIGLVTKLFIGNGYKSSRYRINVEKFTGLDKGGIGRILPPEESCHRQDCVVPGGSFAYGHRQNPAYDPSLIHQRSNKNPLHTPATPFGGTHDPLEPYERLSKAYPKINQAILKNHPKAILPPANSKQEFQAKKTLAALVKLDKYTEAEVCETLNWVLNKEPDSTGFTWKDQFRSIAQLREVKAGATKFTKMFEAKSKFVGKLEPEIDPDVAEANRKWREGHK